MGSINWHLSGPQPYEVQLEAMRRVKGHDRYGFFLEQGLGKTALQLNDYVENFSELDTVVILCPNSFKLDWGLAPQEWGLDLKTRVWPLASLRPGSINIINFESARAKSGYAALKNLMDDSPCLLVVDESSAIKNFQSDTARAVLDLSKRAKAVRLLNGTPMSQNVMDLFPQLKCIGELDRVNPYAFRNRFAVLGGFMGKQVIGVRNEEELHLILDNCSFRALKKDWSDLPEKIHTVLHLEMTPKQRKHYTEIMENFYTLVGGHEFTAAMVLTAMDKARQVVSGILLDGDKSVLLEEPQNNPKIKATLEIMNSGPGKTIIVYFYAKTGEILLDTMRKQGLNPSYLRGGMKPHEIVEQKAKFNDDSSCRVKVAQITTSSRGHTLIGGPGNDRCSRMIFHDNTFSLLDRLQMEDRIHRGAQDKACQYFDLCMSPIDEAQIKALDKKQNMASAVVDAVRALKSRRV